MAAALEAGEIGAWEWDLLSGEMRWSGQMALNLGLAPDLEGDLYVHLLSAIDPVERKAVRAAFAGFRKRLGPVRIEAKLVPNDEPHWIVFLGQTVAGPSGRPARMHGITIDSTRRRKTEAAAAAATLSESEHRLRELGERLQRRAERRHRQLGASRAQIQAIFDIRRTG